MEVYFESISPAARSTYLRSAVLPVQHLVGQVVGGEQINGKQAKGVAKAFAAEISKKGLAPTKKAPRVLTVMLRRWERQVSDVTRGRCRRFVDGLNAAMSWGA